MNISKAFFSIFLLVGVLAAQGCGATRDEQDGGGGMIQKR